MRPFGIAGLQLQLARGDNIARITAEVAAVKARMPWVEMVVLGELALFGASTADAQPMPGDAEAKMSEAARAAAGALPFIRQADETIVATVTDDTALRPGQSGIELTHLLARHGAHASFMAVPAARRGVLESLMECARERSADLLVLGIVRHTPLHDLVFGGATADLFQGTARLPCLVAS